jgi:CubicO group peptidase (beta-lactamase class C family)
VSSRRWRAEAALAVVCTVVMLVVSGAVLWRTITIPVHKDAGAVPSAAAAAPSDRYAGPVEESRRLARALAVDDNLSGLSVSVAVNGEIVWAEGFGWADVESRTPLTPLTRFRLGALSKPLTAVAAARLHDQGRLDLDAPVQRYVPEYPQKQWPVTTRQLLGDVAGVHRIRGDHNDAMPVEHCGSLDEAVALLEDDPLLFEPGTQHRYSIWGWVLVSAVVEGAAGESFAHFMVRQVFEPLAMTRTVVAETDGLDGVAHGAGRRPDYSCVAGAGAFLSTPTDLATRLGDAEARAVDGGHDRRLSDARAARLWSAHDLRAGLDGHQPPTRRRAGTDGQSPR